MNICDDWERHKGCWSYEKIEKHNEKLLILSEEQVRGLQKKEHVKEVVLRQEQLLE